MGPGAPLNPASTEPAHSGRSINAVCPWKVWMGASVSQSTPSLPAWSELEKHLTGLQLLLFPGAAGPAALDKG